jgi:hypothetical protein
VLERLRAGPVGGTRAGMSETFVVAARLSLPKKAVTAYLRDAFPEPGIIANAAEMFAGGSWAGRAALSFDAPTAKTIRHWFGAIADRVAVEEPEGIIVGQESSTQSLFVHHMAIGLDEAALAGTLMALAAASKHRKRKAPDHAVLVAETTGRMAPDSVVAILEIGAGTARFISAAALDRVVADLEPAFARYEQALDRGLAQVLSDPQYLHPQVRLAAKRVEKARPAAIEFASLEEAVAGIRDVRLVDEEESPDSPFQFPRWGDFERSLMPIAREAARFGPEIAPRLLDVMRDDTWEAGIVAYWTLNQLSLATRDPSYFASAVELWARWDPAKRQHGTVRGETTSDSGILDHHRALASGDDLVARLIEALDAELDLNEQGGSTWAGPVLFRELYDQHGEAALLQLHRRRYRGDLVLTESHPHLSMMRADDLPFAEFAYLRFFKPETLRARLIDQHPELHRRYFDGRGE